MRTAEEWEQVFARGKRGLFSILREALAERDAEIARARAAEHLARCERGDHEQEHPDLWAEIRAAAVEEVRGQVVDLMTKLGAIGWTIGDSASGIEPRPLRDHLHALGPSRPPLSPTEAEAGLWELLAWIEDMPSIVPGYISASMKGEIADRIRKILGE